MSVFDPKTVEYAYPHCPWQSDESGFYFSDSIIQPFVTNAKGITKRIFEQQLDVEHNNQFTLQHTVRPFKLSWKESCSLVISAFKDFSPSLGTKAEAAINSTHRWKLSQIRSGNARGICYPANCKENSNNFAIIEYQCDGTINDPIYIAHELGHLIADDLINEVGFSYQDIKGHLSEVQAFFTQHILYDYLSKHKDNRIRVAGLEHFIYEVMDSMYCIPIGIGALEAEKSAQSGGNNGAVSFAYEHTINKWLGPKWFCHERAKTLADQILCARARDDLGISDLHQHAMASILAYGIFLQVQEFTSQGKSQAIDMLYGAHGSDTLNDIFAKKGIVSQNDLDILADKSTKCISQLFERWKKQVEVIPPGTTPEYII